MREMSVCERGRSLCMCVMREMSVYEISVCMCVSERQNETERRKCIRIDMCVCVCAIGECAIRECV